MPFYPDTAPDMPELEAIRADAAKLADLVDLYVSERTAALEHEKAAHMAMAGILSHLTDEPAGVEKVLHVITRARGV